MNRSEAFEEQNIESLKAELRRAQERLKIIYQNTSLSSWDYNIKTREITQNQRAMQLHGFDAVVKNVPESLIQNGYVHPDSAREFLEMYDRLFAGEPRAEGVFRVQTADRSGYWYEHICYTVMFDENGIADTAIGISTDVSAEMRMKRDSETDDLTQLLNHRTFFDRATVIIEESPGIQHTLAFIDIDDFKQINDTFGHITGDRILTHVGKCIGQASGNIDKTVVPARVGGDEFAVMIKDASRETAAKYAEELLRLLSLPTADGIKVSASIGIALFPSNASSFYELYLAADRTAYNIKRNGKNSFSFYDDMFTGDEETLRLRQQFLSDTIAGGMMGGYIEEGFPYYFIDERMLQWLGYNDEAEFVRHIEGLIENCIHPDDRKYVNDEVEKQLARTGRYAVDYRLRKKDESFIWVHDVGKRMTAADGRPAITSVCYDITAEKEHANLINRLIEDTNGSLALYRVEEDWKLTLVYASRDVWRIANYTNEEYRVLCRDGFLNTVYEMDRGMVMEQIKTAIDEDIATSANYRVPDRNGGYIWISGVFSKFGDDDSRPILRAVFMPAPLQFELRMQSLNSDTIGVDVIDDKTEELYYANEACFKIHGVPATDITAKTCHEAFYDKPHTCEFCWRNSIDASPQNEYVHIANNKTISIEAQKRRWNNRDVVIVYIKDVTQKYELQRLRDELMNNIPGGICLFRIGKDDLEILAFNDALAQVLGLDSSNALCDDNKQSLFGCVHPDDLQGLQNFINENVIRPGKHCEYRYRIWHQTKNAYVWIEIRANIVRQGDETMAYVIYSDVTFTNQIQQELENSNRAMEIILRYGNLGVWTYDLDTKRLIQKFSTYKAYGYDIVCENIPYSYIEQGVIHPDDADAYRECYEKILGGFESSDCVVRVFVRTISIYQWVHVYLVRQADLADGSRRAIGFCVVVDKEINSIKQLEQVKLKLQQANTRFEQLLQYVDAGVVIYRYSIDSRVRIEYVSQGFLRLWGGTEDEIMATFVRSGHAENVDSEYLREVENAYRTAYKTLEPTQITYRVNYPNKDIQWIMLRMRAVRTGNDVMLYASYNDVTDMVSAQEKLSQSQEMIEASCSFANIWFFSYDIDNNVAYMGEKLMRDYNVPKVVENYFDEIFKYNIIKPEYRDLYKEQFARFSNGEDEISFEIQSSLNGEVHWTRIRGKVVGQYANGRTAAISAQTIDTEKVMQARLEMERAKTQKNTENLLLYFVANVSKNAIIEYKGMSKSETSYPMDVSMDDFIKSVYSRHIYESDRKKAERVYDREGLIANYHNGVLNEEYTSYMPASDGIIRLTRHVDHLLQDPMTRDILLYEYVYDISKEQIMDAILQMEINFGYEAIGFLIVSEDQFTVLEINGEDNHAYSTITSFSGYMRDYAEKCVHPEDRQRFLDHYLNRDFVNEKPSHTQVVYRGIDDGNVQYYKGTLYLHEEEDKRFCTLTRRNHTQTMLNEQMERQRLEDALKKARDADRAKSEFLARMSHDMRTPINAIMGLGSLTVDACENPEEVRLNMTRLHSASDFLLSLVDDILDMAKIEDRSLSLNLEPYMYSEFLMNMQTIFRPQCEAKGIRLTFKKPAINPMIRCDKLRLVQIFYNIFSNAVKYTPAGGTIDYTVKNLVIKDGRLSVDYIVKDSGIGMSEEYQKRMFEPFSREDNSVTAELQGSGLGLSITKQLVELMGGKLRIDSKKGSGTTVTVSLGFECLCEDAREETTGETVNETSRLEGKVVLLAEDHPLNAEITKKLLEKKGMTVLWAKNGKIAAEMFHSSEINSIDAILMDIRMPEMSGLEATRLIRSSSRDDAKTIPIIALSSNAYPEDVQQSINSGMNEHVSKPVDPSALYLTLEKYM
ncbi:MAG: PAS domain-containing protein [Clostridia bacterium]|nr:PAS domain-containing protein [Clostridia bacterium]